MVFEQQNYIENVLTLLLSSNLLIVKSIISSEFTLAREGGIHHREKEQIYMLNFGKENTHTFGVVMKQ